MILETLILRYELKGKARTHSVAHVRPRSKNRAKNQNRHIRRYSFESVIIRFVSKKQAI